MEIMTKEQIISARNLSVSEMIESGFTFEELLEIGEISREYYSPSDSYEYFDGENFYDIDGQILRDPEEYDPYSEGYTPFGDE